MAGEENFRIFLQSAASSRALAAYVLSRAWSPAFTAMEVVMNTSVPGRTLLAALLLVGAADAQASSPRAAPFISSMPKVDAADFYMFNSYESGRGGYVTLIADYVPLQDA